MIMEEKSVIDGEIAYTAIDYSHYPFKGRWVLATELPLFG
jgi:hypothetical protein